MGKDSKGEGDNGDGRKNTLKEHNCRKIRLTNDRRNYCRLFILRKNVKAKKRTRLHFFIQGPRFGASSEEEGV